MIKHLPDQAFLLDETLYRRMARRFESELSRWSSSEDLHMVMMATFGVGADLVPAIDELTLMPVTREWIPVSDAIEQQLVERLVREERTFVKLLQYNLAGDRPLATAMLTDTEAGAVPLFVQSDSGEEGAAARMAQFIAEAASPAWTWHPGHDVMPALPPSTRSQRCEDVRA